ncbi:hypothetical protein C8Q73DRAFT_669004 [Cubamyces lactineus]|nr:hypothetical protein C8Q73DRAFT_669004 [Cubamyces lactineus]
MDPYPITIASSLKVIRSVSAAAFAILYYDYTLTIRHEVERFWGATISVTSVLYFVNRYLSLFATIPVFVEFYRTNSQTVIVGALQIMRTYALCGRSRRVLLSLLGLCGAECIISAWAVAKAWQSTEKHKIAQVGESIGCDLTMSRTQGQYMAAIWGCILIFDAVVFGLTFVRVFKAGKLWHGSLFALLLRDGSSSSVTSRISSLVCSPTGFSVTATNVIATSMMSRLMLKIRDPKLRDAVYHLPAAGSARPGGHCYGRGPGASGTSEVESGTVTVHWASTHS